MCVESYAGSCVIGVLLYVKALKELDNAVCKAFSPK
jgi:hypothetical protein